MKRLQRDLSSGDNKVSHESAVSRQEKKPPKNGQLVWACGLLEWTLARNRVRGHVPR